MGLDRKPSGHGLAIYERIDPEHPYRAPISRAEPSKHLKSGRRPRTVRPEQAEDTAEGQLNTHGVNSVEGLAVLRISLRESIGFYSDLVQASPFPGARGAPPLMPVLAGGPTACHRGA